MNKNKYLLTLCEKFLIKIQIENKVTALNGLFKPHYGPGVDSYSNRNEYQESSWG
jgi:hypothetical protein